MTRKTRALHRLHQLGAEHTTDFESGRTTENGRGRYLYWTLAALAAGATEQEAADAWRDGLDWAPFTPA